MAWKFPKLSRRTFLKTTGAGAAGLTLLKANTLVGKNVGLSHVKSEDTSYTICNFCSSLCNVKVTTRVSDTDGVKRIVKLDGNPHSTLNRGKLCARGQAGVRQTYDKDRFKTPLIRVEGSKRGEWKFREASWEDAWKYIEERTNSPKKGGKIQPWEWTLVGGWTSCIFYMYWSVPFAVVNGIPNIVASPMQHCVTTGHLGTDSVTGNFNVHDEILPDYDNAKYIIYVGNNSSIAGVSTCRAVRFAQAKKNGAKLVVLDPRLSETGSKADEWVAIRPGTDLDFCLAMLREMLDKKLYDSEFLRSHTNMPFLAYKDDNGWHLAKNKQGQYLALRDGTSDIHVLPAYTNSNRTDVSGKALYPALYAPEGTKIPAGFEGEGKSAVTVLQAQFAEIEHCTFEWAEKTTNVPAEKIRQITHEFATTRPALIDPGWHGARFGNMMMARRVQAMLQALNGGFDKMGGWIMGGEYRHKLVEQVKAKQEGKQLPAPMMTKAGLDFALFVVGAFSNGDTFQPHGNPGWAWMYSGQQRAEGKQGVVLPALADEGMKESVEGKVKLKNGQPYLTRAIFINAANPVRHYYPDTYWKDMMANDNVELVVALDVLPSDTTPYADVILPHSTYLERAEPMIYGNGTNQDLALATRYAAIDPLYDSREIPDVLLGLTEIISGKKGAMDRLTGAMEMMAGIPAAPIKEKWEQLKTQEDMNSPFSEACRQVVFDEAAKKLHISTEKLDKVFREKGIYHKEDWQEMIKHHAIAYHLPVPTGSGRIEFYSNLFDMLRGMGGTTPHFNVLAAPIVAECREGKTMADALPDDEFYFAYGKVPTVSYGSTNSNNPVLAAINFFKKDIYTGVWMHPNRAEKLGIKTGDKIKLTNTLSDQKADGHVYVTRQVREDTLFIQSAFGVENPQLELSFKTGGTATNKLIPHNVDPVVAGFRSQEFTLRVTKA